MGQDRVQRTCSKGACQKARHRRQSLAYHRRQAAEILCERLAQRTTAEVTAKLDKPFFDRLAASLAAQRERELAETAAAAVAHKVSPTYKTQRSPFLRDEFWLHFRVIFQTLHHLALRSMRDELSAKSAVATPSSRSQPVAAWRDDKARAQSTA